MANYQSTHTGEQIDEAVDKVLPLVSTAEQIDDTVNKVATQIYTNHNFISNAWYTINQRGQTSYSASGYTVDRWKTANASGVFTPTDNGLNIKANGAIYFSHYIENASALLGKTLTLSAMLADGTIKTVTKTVQSSFPVSGDVEQMFFLFNSGLRLRFTFGVGTAFVMFTAPNGVNETVRAVKLELGSVSTLVNDTAPNYAEELLRCQRFAYLLPISTSYCSIGTGYSPSATSARIVIHTPTEMASNPNIVYLAGSVSNLGVIQNGSAFTVTALTAEKSGCAVFLAATVASGLVNNNLVGIRAMKSQVQILLSADL